MLPWLVFSPSTIRVVIRIINGDSLPPDVWVVLSTLAIVLVPTLACLWIDKRQEWRQKKALNNYQTRIFSAVIDELLVKTFETNRLPSEEEVQCELEKQVLNNDHWRQELIRQGGIVMELPTAKLVEAFNQKVKELNLPKYTQQPA